MFFCVDSNETIVLKPVGDVELWYAEAADRSWRLPLHVEWKEDESNGNLYGLILPGTCFYHTQLLAMQAILGRFSLEERIDRWLVARPDIESILHKAPGIHASFYYHWPNTDHAPIPSNHGMSVITKPRPSRFGSFAEYISVQRHIPLDVVNVVLTAIGQCGSEWMVRYHQPIELGFVRLLAVPFRINWKAIVLFKGKAMGLLNALLAEPRRECRHRLSQMKVAATLCSPNNIALRGGSHQSFVDYSIEAMTTSAFQRAVEQIEEERLQRADYVAQHGKTVERLYESIVDCLVHYAQKTQAAWASVSKGRNGGGASFVPATSKIISGISPSNIPVDIVEIDSDFSVFAERDRKSKRVAVSPKADEVQGVSAVPPAADDVRRRGGNGDVDQS